MSAHPPPVPPDQRSSKDPARNTAPEAAPKKQGEADSPRDEKTGNSGAIRQNTRNTGHQQDR
jgi:hypothetical protein